MSKIVSLHKDPTTPMVGGDKVKKSIQKVKNKLHLRSGGFGSKLKDTQEKDAMLFQVLNPEKEVILYTYINVNRLFLPQMKLNKKKTKKLKQKKVEASSETKLQK